MLQDSSLTESQITPSLTSSAMSAATTATKNPLYPEQEQNLRCPRCDSTNTKFCYYNNYNLSQPRHFCKSCRRYWTKGGALRNVPVGGGTRKNSKRASAMAAANSTIAKRSISTPNASTTLPEASKSNLAPPLYPQFDQDHCLLNMSGCSFSSLLGVSSGHIGSLVHGNGTAVIGGEGLELQSSSGDDNNNGEFDHRAAVLMPMPESFIGLHGDGSCWNGGEWTDLTIYHQTSRFQ